MRVAFIGGLTNGRIVYDYLQCNKHVDLVMAVTHPDDPSRARYAEFPDADMLIRSVRANDYVAELRAADPDLIIVAGWSELLNPELLAIPSMGVIGFHPSRLPENKGRSVLAWQIEEGYTQTALTMFYYNDMPDGGDIIAQETISIAPDDYINDVLDKVDGATYNLMYAYFPLLRQGKAPRKRQDPTQGTFRRLRKDRDSLIDWNQPSEHICNKIRAVSHPYPGAWGWIDNVKVRIWRGEVCRNFSYGHDVLPGTVVARLYDGTRIIRTRDGFIRITESENI